VRFWASEAAAAIGAELVGPDVEIDGVSFDSRTVLPGQLFVSLVAARDGHQFVAAARAAGAAAYLTARDPEGGTALRVTDTARALLELGAWARRKLAERQVERVVGITGSVGKTTTKDLIAAAARDTFRTAAAERSFNNDQGLPVTLLNAPDDVEVVVLEMGMRGFGEIARLCRIGRPTVGVVTAVGEAHTELVGGIEGVAVAKGELVEALPADGIAVLNGDDVRVAAMAGRTAARVLTYGAGEHCDVRIDELVLDAHARPRFTCRTPWGVVDVELGLAGRHMASNAAAAITVAGALGVPLDTAAAALRAAEITGMRMEILHTASGARIVNDAYNANPTSVVAALDALAAMAGRRKVAVLGVMAEITEPAEQHRRVAAHAAALGIEVVPVGTDLYGPQGVEVADVPVVLGSLASGDAVLVKGSRMAGLERVVALLVEEVVGGETA
jgi:UDP-N-acetylmuramoyl-tripeptide--D-alanyl-D-alanine ligase